MLPDLGTAYADRGGRGVIGKAARLWRQVARQPSALVLLNTGGQSVIRFASNIVLAQLLLPSAFALTALTLLIITGLQMATDIGLVTIALRYRDMSAEDRDKLWSVQLVRSLGVAGAVALVSVPMARLYHTPELAPVMCGIAAMTALHGLNGLYHVLQYAERDLVPSVRIDLGGRIVSTLVSIGVALVTPTVWALVIGLVAQAAFSAAVSHLQAPYGLPRFRWDLGFIRSHWTYSRWIQLSSTLSFGAAQLDRALFPLLYGMPMFGLYGVGYTLAIIPAQVTHGWCGNIFYPLVVRADDAAHRARLAGVRSTMLMLCAAVGAAVALAAPSFFYIFYKPAFHLAGRFAELLALIFFFEMAELSLRSFPLAAGSSRYEVVTTAARLFFFLLCAAGVWWGRLGPEAYAFASLVAQAGSYALMLAVAVRRGDVRPGADLAVAGPVAALGAITWFLPFQPGSLAVAWTVLAGVGAGTAAVILLIYRVRGLPSLAREGA